MANLPQMAVTTQHTSNEEDGAFSSKLLLNCASVRVRVLAALTQRASKQTTTQGCHDRTQAIVNDCKQAWIWHTGPQLHLRRHEALSRGVRSWDNSNNRPLFEFETRMRELHRVPVRFYNTCTT